MRALLQADSLSSLEVHCAVLLGHSEHRGGQLVHLIPGRIIEGGRTQALCLRKPREQSDGWTYTGGQITCRRCKDLLERIPEGQRP